MSSTLVLSKFPQDLGGVDVNGSGSDVADVDVGIGGNDFAGGDEVHPVIVGDGNETGDGSAAVGDLDRLLASCDPAEVPAGVLAKFPHADLLHVLRGSTLSAQAPRAINQLCPIRLPG